MKICTFILLSFVFCVKAFASDTSIKNLNINYSNDTGVGSFEQFIFSDYQYDQSLKFDIQFDGSTIIFELPDRTVEINDEQGFIVGVENSTLENFNLLTETDKLSVGLKLLSENDKEGRTIFQNFKASCELENTPIERDLYNYLDNCLTNSVVSLGYFQTESYNSMIANILEETFETVAASKTSLSNTRLDIDNHYFFFKTKADIGMKANLKINGQTRYLEKSKEVKVTITKAKAGFLNIKNKIFKELEKSESEKMRVQRPHIYIKLD